MEFGKIGKDLIGDLFGQRSGAPLNTVLQGPAFGVDTAIIDLGHGNGLAVASDPLSFIPPLGMKASAWLSVLLVANDIATTGYLPQYAQFVLNLPLTMHTGDLQEYWTHIHGFCASLGIAITGGHTGFDQMGPTTLAGGGTMFAAVNLNRVKTSALARPGHDLLMTKTAALSSSAILAMSFPQYIQMHLGNDCQRRLADGFYHTSVLDEVRILNSVPAQMNAVSAMHDVTEGGVLGAVFELAEAAGTGVCVDSRRIRVGRDQREVCNLFGLDPLCSVGAGSMLIVCDPKATHSLAEILQAKGIPVSLIGHLTQDKKKIVVNGQGLEEVLSYTDTDPYWQAFALAMERGLK